MSDPRTGANDALPAQDVFGDPRQPGNWSSRGIGGGRLVVYPSGADMAAVEAAIAEIVAAQSKPKRGKAASEAHHD